MTEQAPAYEMFGCITAQDARSVLNTLVCDEGVGAGTTELRVTAGAGMSVNVAAGEAFIEGDFANWDGMYHVLNDGTVAVPVTAADPVNDRIDIVIAQIRDAQYSGALNDWDLQVIAGVPSAVPVAPATPPSALLLAEVLVPAGAVSSASFIITDMRQVYELCAAAQKSAFSNAGVYTTDGNYAIPADAKALFVRVVGGGGAGGGATATNAATASAGSGGAGGGAAEKWLQAGVDFTPGAVVPVTVGQGGGAVAGGVGGTGSNSSFGAFCSATGGQGGATTSTVANGAADGALLGGTGVGGDINYIGGGGHAGFVITSGTAGVLLAVAGHGGAAVFGSPGPRNRGITSSFAVGNTGSTGSGGSGAATGPSEINPQPGGPGGDGYVIVWAFR